MAGERILIIDDETEIRLLLKEILEGDGYAVCLADGGAAGLAVLEREHIDVVITDIIMPDKEGLETIMEIKQNWPALKIIAMSGALQRVTYLELADRFGVNACLAKPFRAAQIRETLKSILGQ